MNNLNLTRGQKAWVTRRMNLAIKETKNQVKVSEARKTAWETRRAKYGTNGMSKKPNGVLPTETKFVTIEDKKSGFKVQIEQSKINTVMVWGNTIQLL